MSVMRSIASCAFIAATTVCGSIIAQEPKQGASFGFLAEKVRQKEPVSIAYIGGSITQGSGASKYGNNYFWKSKSAIEAEIAKRGSKASTVTAAIGGTNSSYGAYRLGAQILVHKPDLLVVEYAVNDGSSKPEEAVDGMEGIVRQALRQNPKMTIVFLYTSKASYEEQYYSKELLPPSVESHRKVAAHYGILEVNAGPLVDKELKAGAFTLKEAFPDTTHPSDAVHALYAQALTDAVLPLLDAPAPASTAALPAPLGSASLEYARLDPVKPIGELDGWTKNAKQWNWYGVEIYTCDAPGKTLSFEAKGKGIQLVYLGQIQVRWTAGGKECVEKLNGRFGLPFPASFRFPDNASPDGAAVSVEALPDASGKARGEVWGLFSVQKP